MAQLDANAIVIASGTVLAPEVAYEGRGERFVDIAGIAPLRVLRVDAQGASIGALVSNDEISGHPEIARDLCCAGWIGNPHVRRAGTIGGNLVWALPRACLPPALLGALDVEVTLQSVHGVFTQPVSQLLSNGLPPRTLLVSVQLPTPANRRSGYPKYAGQLACSEVKLACGEGVASPVAIAHALFDALGTQFVILVTPGDSAKTAMESLVVPRNGRSRVEAG